MRSCRFSGLLVAPVGSGLSYSQSLAFRGGFMPYCRKFRWVLFFAAAVVIFASVLPAAAQRRDFVTEQEAELIRKYQSIDERIDILVKMIDRRLVAAGISDVKWRAKKDSDEWGPEPTGTRLELLSDIRRLFQKAVDDIDDVASRSSNTVETNVAGSPELNSAVRNLAAAARRLGPLFESEAERVENPKERGLLLESADLARQVLEAESNLPKEQPGNRKSKNKPNS